MSVKPVAWTPGPWTEAWSGRTDGSNMTGVSCEIQGPEIDSKVFVPMRPTICDVRDHMSRRIWQANARLIASAPELAEALEILTAACEKDFCSPKTEGGECPAEDDEAVAAGFEGDCAVTFGMIRAARKLLARITPK